jgi:hypothetical protein
MNSNLHQSKCQKVFNELGKLLQTISGAKYPEHYDVFFYGAINKISTYKCDDIYDLSLERNIFMNHFYKIYSSHSETTTPHPYKIRM